jgi:hypothetical protein
MKSVIALFSEQSEIEAVLEELYQLTDDEDEIEVRRVEGFDGVNAAARSGRMELPVPTTGGVVPMIDINDLDLTTEERGYLNERAGSQAEVLRIRAKDEYIDQVEQVVNRHNGQSVKKAR